MEGKGGTPEKKGKKTNLGEVAVLDYGQRGRELVVKSHKIHGIQ